MSNRFHNKWHRVSHHTYRNPGILDAGWDPIASDASPFMGDFVLSPDSSTYGFNHDWSVSARRMDTQDIYPWDEEYNRVYVHSNLFVDENETVGSSLFVHGNANVTGYADIIGDISGHSDLYVSGNVYLYSGLTASGPVLFRDTLEVYKNISGHENLCITGYADIIDDISGHGDLYVSGNESVTGTLDVRKDISGHKDLYVSGNESVTGTLGVRKDISGYKDLYIIGNEKVSGYSYVSGNISGLSDLSIVGSAYVSGDVTASGHGKIGKNLIVEGSGSFGNCLNVNKDISGYKDLYITGNADVSGNIHGYQDLYVNSGISASGDIHGYRDLYVNSGISASGNIHGYQDLYVNSGISASGDIHGYKNLYVTSAIRASGDIYGYKNLYVTSAISASGNIVAYGADNRLKSVNANGYGISISDTTIYRGTNSSNTKGIFVPMVAGTMAVTSGAATSGNLPEYKLTSDSKPYLVDSGKSIKDLNNLVNTTWADLRNKRNDGQLIPGQQYRITDYVTTTTQTDTQSAGHQFDIIVVADSINKLNEHARATRHEGDSYFPDGTKFEAWDIWYCLDNDTNRFAWADTVNGKGVIYRMIDEWWNDVPYDFKNIQFKAYGDTDDVWRYTFDSGDEDENTDTSLYGGVSGDFGQNWVSRNTICPYLKDGVGQVLNGIVFKGTYCHYNTFGDGCYSNTFGDNCYANTFGDGCSSNTFGDNCYANTFGDECSTNKFGDGCYSNTFGDYCYSNTFGDYCSSNTFGDYCSSNTFSIDCYSNTFGNSCFSNTFGNSCYANTFGHTCHANTFGDNCFSNTFGDSCYSNTFGDSCYSNTFGDSCYVNTFGHVWRTFSELVQYAVGDYVRYYNKFYRCVDAHYGAWNVSHFTEESPVLSYYQYIDFESGVRYTVLECTATRSDGSDLYQNVTVAKGVSGSFSSPKLIQDPNVNQDFKTTYQSANSQVISI